MAFFAVSAAAALTVWTLWRTVPIAAATGGALTVIPSAALSLLGLHGVGLPAVYGGAALAGIAFGAVSQGASRMMLASLDERDRAATLAAYYVLNYLPMSLPAIAAGAPPSTSDYGQPPTPTSWPPPSSTSRRRQHSPRHGARHFTPQTTFAVEHR
ncbi:hypothetical protein [Streptomyces sp. NPDC058086]|uniref:hypothetical protein n=1 Tax=Streptomyces sp. NPDC058086 TaxID=3346334 RepID=UPI0036F0613E